MQICVPADLLSVVRLKMAVAFLQQVLVCSFLVLAIGLLVPRMLGGGKSPRPPATPGRHHHHHQLPPTGHAGKSPLHASSSARPHENVQHMRKAVEQEMKKKTGSSGRGFSFTLMPLYAIGVGVFAAYKFMKIKSEKENSSKKEKQKEALKKKVTENQLVELEQHLAHTEVMLNSLLSQLDPLSNCVNNLAMGQREEIMTQLQSIRTLMKDSGIDKSSDGSKDSVENSMCNNKLEGLIESFGQNYQKKDMDEDKDDSVDDMEESESATESSCDRSSTEQLSDLDTQESEGTVIGDHETDKETSGLRQRNRRN